MTEPTQPGWYWARWRGYGKPWNLNGEFEPTQVKIYDRDLAVPNHSGGHGDPYCWDLLHYEWGPEVTLPPELVRGHRTMCVPCQGEGIIGTTCKACNGLGYSEGPVSGYEMTYERDGNKMRADFDTETGELVIKVSGPDLLDGNRSDKAKEFVTQMVQRVRVALWSTQDLHREDGSEGG